MFEFLNKGANISVPPGSAIVSFSVLINKNKQRNIVVSPYPIVQHHQKYSSKIICLVCNLNILVSVF